MRNYADDKMDFELFVFGREGMIFPAVLMDTVGHSCPTVLFYFTVLS